MEGDARRPGSKLYPVDVEGGVGVVFAPREVK